MAQRQTVQLRRLVDNLLEVTRITQGKIELRPEPITAGTAVYQAADSLAHEFTARRHELSIELPTRPVQIFVDPIRLAQVLENLLHNACKYTPDGAHIRVVLEAEPEAVEIRVIDDGVGIDPGKIPTLFALFQQLEVSIDRAQGGLGVGLTMVKRLVEMQGSAIRAESAGLGRGSCFVVRLPSATAAGGGAVGAG